MRCLLAVLLLSSLADAQAVDPEKAALIRQIIQTSTPGGLKNQILNLTKLMRTSLMRDNPSYPAAYADEFEKRLASRFQDADLAQLSIPIYAKTFSVEELKQILAFHQSPVGQKLAAAQPEILAETGQASLRYAQQIVPEVNREIVAEHPEWKKQLEETNSPPSLISKVAPDAPEAQKSANFKGGTVVVSILIDEQGVPQDAQIVQPLGSGFDEKAIEAVQKWRFKPGTRNGVPVKVRAKVEVNFKILPKQ
jgi:TonB family protein